MICPLLALSRRLLRIVPLVLCLAHVSGLSSAQVLTGSTPIELQEEMTSDDREEALETTLPQGFHDQFVTVDGHKIHFVVGGSGKPLLLLHGFPTTWYEWRSVMPQLADRYTVIAADLPGSGDSDAPGCCYDKKTMANEFYVALQRLGYRTVSIVGHDIGGMVAYAYAAQHPAAVDRLAIMDVPLPTPAFYVLPALNADGDTSFWHFGFLNVERLPEQLIGGRERIFVNYFVRHLAAEPVAFPRKNISIYARYLALPGHKHGAFGYYRAFRQDVLDNEQLGKTKLSIPALAIGGDHTAGAMEADYLTPFFDNITSSVILNSGHWIPEEQPDELIRAIEAFFPS